ncbi:hypothetical protein SDC9_17432 [bioreactor metagenome]|uniref:Uncharacterized protein n=1 Tax=bioreactor metagenome TaxID=1076179 RepID=A0A644TXI4_9ZZZZ
MVTVESKKEQIGFRISPKYYQKIKELCEGDDAPPGYGRRRYDVSDPAGPGIAGGPDDAAGKVCREITERKPSQDFKNKISPPRDAPRRVQVRISRSDSGSQKGGIQARAEISSSDLSADDRRMILMIRIQPHAFFHQIPAGRQLRTRIGKHLVCGLSDIHAPGLQHQNQTAA